MEKNSSKYQGQTAQKMKMSWKFAVHRKLVGWMWSENKTNQYKNVKMARKSICLRKLRKRNEFHNWLNRKNG